MTEPHWPEDGSGDEADGGYDPTAYGGTTLSIDVGRLAQAIEAWWTPINEHLSGPGTYTVTLDPVGAATAIAAAYANVAAPDEGSWPSIGDMTAAEFDDYATRSGIKAQLIRQLTPASDPNYHPGDYESPHTAPFVQVRVNGELVPGHIVYPWPDGGLVVEPLEVAP